jgi:hypothetical protein
MFKTVLFIYSDLCDYSTVICLFSSAAIFLTVSYLYVKMEQALGMFYFFLMCQLKHFNGPMFLLIGQPYFI